MPDSPNRRLTLVVTGSDPVRLDKALALAAPPHAALTRTRVQRLIRDGMVSKASGEIVLEPDTRCYPGETWVVEVKPLPIPTTEPNDIPLEIVYEDNELLVVDKPAGMTVHPAPGSEDGTLLNAVLHHCGGNLADTGNPLRPGIVHRIDKDTSGLLVVAKTGSAHVDLSNQFAAHDVERLYIGFCHGVPERSNPRLTGLESVSLQDGGVFKVTTSVGRNRADRKKMAVVRSGGRRAVTRFRVVDAFSIDRRSRFAKINFWLETGRTHQIRLHMLHLGHPLVGDPVYGGGRRVPEELERVPSPDGMGPLARQALHAGFLGFAHPKTGRRLRFQSELPGDLKDLECALIDANRNFRDSGTG